MQIEPEYRPTYLALAVSYINEGDHQAAYTMLERWIDLADAEVPPRPRDYGLIDRQESVKQDLIDMARRNPEEVDADIQVALGVLFSSSDVRVL